MIDLLFILARCAMGMVRAFAARRDRDGDKQTPDLSQVFFPVQPETLTEHKVSFADGGFCVPSSPGWSSSFINTYVRESQGKDHNMNQMRE